MRHIISFSTGIFAAMIALVLQLVAFLLFTKFAGKELFPVLSATHILSLTAFLPITAFIEELCKYLMIIARIKIFHTRRVLVLHAIFVGIGFAAMEYSLLLLGDNSDILTISLGNIILLHLFTATFMGALLTLMRKRVLLAFLSIILAATILHTLYNMAIFFFPSIVSSLTLFLLSGTIFLLLFAFARDRELAQSPEIPYNENA